MPAPFVAVLLDVAAPGGTTPPGDVGAVDTLEGVDVFGDVAVDVVGDEAEPGDVVPVLGAVDVCGVVVVVAPRAVDDGVVDVDPVVPTAPGVGLPGVFVPLGWPGRVAPAIAPDVSGLADRVPLSLTAVSGTQGD